MDAVATKPVGEQIRAWRERRRMSQLELSQVAEISARHLSFVETGRSQPSRALVLKLADRLQVPLRHRNALLTAAGLAPMYAERRLDDPALEQAKHALELVLRGHEPYPALAVDRHWNLIAANRAVGPLIASAAPALLAPPINVLRLSLHPDGLASKIENLAEWKAHALERLAHQCEATLDPVLEALHRELSGYGPPIEGDHASATPTSRSVPVVITLKFASPAGTLELISTTTVFGTPLDVTLSEIAIESFFPANESTAHVLRALVA